MRLAARDDDKVALGHGELASLFEREGSRATTEIMEQGVGVSDVSLVDGPTLGE
jgi:hypothetical protein